MLKAVLSLLFVLLCGVNCSAAGNSDYIINIPESLKNSTDNADVQFILNQAYGNLGITPRYVYLPTPRSKRYLESGEIQAEAFRTKEVGDTFNGATQIAIEFAKIRVAVICIQPKLCEVDSILHYALFSGFERGISICDELDIQCEFVNSATALAKMLDTQIVDAIIITPAGMAEILCQCAATDLYYRFISEVEIPLFHYIRAGDMPFTRALEKSLRDVLRQNPDKLLGFVNVPDISACQKRLHKIN